MPRDTSHGKACKSLIKGVILETPKNELLVSPNMTHEEAMSQWLENHARELLENINKITEYDQYALMQQMDDTMWLFINRHYDSTYKLPYIGIS